MKMVKETRKKKAIKRFQKNILEGIETDEQVS